MSIGPSGRIVLEVDPDMKRRLYGTLTSSGLTLKAWFTMEAVAYIERSTQGQHVTREADGAIAEGDAGGRGPDVAA